MRKKIDPRWVVTVTVGDLARIPRSPARDELIRRVVAARGADSWEQGVWREAEEIRRGLVAARAAPAPVRESVVELASRRAEGAVE